MDFPLSCYIWVLELDELPPHPDSIRAIPKNNIEIIPVLFHFFITSSFIKGLLESVYKVSLPNSVIPRLGRGNLFFSISSGYHERFRDMTKIKNDNLYTDSNYGDDSSAPFSHRWENEY